MAPWQDWADAHASGLSVASIVDRLMRAGRGADEGIPEIDDRLEGSFSIESTETRTSAVLVCLFEGEGPELILTRRAAHLRHHRHEVAFPGGRSEPGESLDMTAVREAHEEVGLNPAEVMVHGFLTPIFTMASQSAIWPVIASYPRRPDFLIDPNEVDRAFTVSVAHLLDPENFVEQRWTRPTTRPTAPDGSFPVHFYRVPEDLIWGATARIITDLLSTLAKDSVKFT